jgi:integrase
MSFVKFMGCDWPNEAESLLLNSIADVQSFRDEMNAHDLAPKTINRRIASLSSFYKYLAGSAAELRLPITVPNPAHAQFIAREASDPRDETKALSATRARQLMGLPHGDSVLASRDRAILKFYLYSGARLSTGCRLKVSDFHQDGEEATIKLHEKGDKRRSIGIHFAAAEAIQEYIQKTGITSGPLFRPRKGSRSEELADRAMNPVSMYLLIQSYLERLPNSHKEIETAEGENGRFVSTLHTRCGRRRRHSSWTPAWTSGKFRSCSDTGISRQRRSTISDDAVRPRAHRTICLSDR